MRTTGAVICLLLGGCAVEELDLGTSESNVECANRLAANRLAANHLSANRLARAPLIASSPEVVTMATEEGGLDYLGYIVSCALPEGTSLTVGTAVLPGQVGLAPKWTERQLRADERRWVSACLLARVNLYGVTVMLSMRSGTGVLAVLKPERADFTLFEGAFWGDVFSSDTLVMSACRSRFKATNPQIGTVPLRECTVPDGTTGLTRCGFQYAGICEDVCAGAKAGSRFDACGGASEVISVVLAQP